MGCYYDWRIYVYDVDNAELDGIKEAVLAHELLHAVWQREKSWTKDELEPLLRDVYAWNKEELADHMKSYDEGNFVDELHSVIGTQVDPARLPLRLRDHYASYFKNHAKIVAYFNQYNNKFVVLKKDMDSLSDSIAKNKDEIEKRTQQYRRDSQKLNDDIDVFNNRAANGFYSNRSYQFNIDRQELVQRQHAVDAQYDRLSGLVDDTNRQVDEYNNKLAESNELYRSINSKIKKIDRVSK